MNTRKSILILAILCFVFGMAITSCKKDKKDDEPTAIETELFNMAKATSGFVWYKNSSALLPKSAGSGHNNPLLRVRYNAVAAAKLDASGKIIAGSVFPENSLIVKELNADATTFDRYAILYKQSGNENADEKGWVWGYLNSDGSVAEPSANKGSACKNCHSQSDNIDYMLMNKYFL